MSDVPVGVITCITWNSHSRDTLLEAISVPGALLIVSCMSHRSGYLQVELVKVTEVNSQAEEHAVAYKHSASKLIH